MHYKIAQNITIKTENAAKPESQRSAFLVNVLRDLPRVSSTFDCGCGKLRYTDVMLESTETITIVDSEIQLSRVQTLKNTFTSIRDVFDKSNNVTVLNDVEFRSSNKVFDRGFCINVLSVIPIVSRRVDVIDVALSRLKRGARCLFVVQYRNSDFGRMRSLPNAQPWRDGFIINSLRGYSFYGIITPKRLEQMVAKAGFVIDDLKLNEGSAYLWAKRE